MRVQKARRNTNRQAGRLETELMLVFHPKTELNQITRRVAYWRGDDRACIRAANSRLNHLLYATKKNVRIVVLAKEVERKRVFMTLNPITSVWSVKSPTMRQRDKHLE